MGTAHTLLLRCPRCARTARADNRPVDETVGTRLCAAGAPPRGSSHAAHRYRVECLDCGHVWATTHPQAGVLHDTERLGQAQWRIVRAPARKVIE